MVPFWFLQSQFFKFLNPVFLRSSSKTHEQNSRVTAARALVSTALPLYSIYFLTPLPWGVKVLMDLNVIHTFSVHPSSSNEMAHLVPMVRLIRSDGRRRDLLPCSAVSATCLLINSWQIMTLCPLPQTTNACGWTCLFHAVSLSCDQIPPGWAISLIVLFAWNAFHFIRSS